VSMQIADCKVPSADLLHKYSLELISYVAAGGSVLYVYRDGKHWTTATGRLNSLREFAARYYPGAQLNERTLG
jgi:hypothetical protein